VLLLLAAVMLLHVLDRQLIAILAEGIKADLNLSDTQLGLLSGLAFSIFYSVLGVPIARCADRGDRSRIIAAATATWSVMTGICGFAGSFASLLIARMGVAVGEAGGLPPLHSLVADYFEAAKRASALAVIQLGGPAGVFAAFIFGGYVGRAFGWRAAFVIAAVPGVLLALLLWFALPGPRRERHRVGARVADGSERALGAARVLLASAAYRFVVLGMVSAGFGLYALLLWLPSMFQRSYGWDVQRTGVVLGLVTGIAGAIGVICGGLATDRLHRTDRAAQARVPAVMMTMAAPLTLLALAMPSGSAAVVALALPIGLASGWQPAAIAAVQSIAAAHQRATASAVALFALNLIGLGLGPLLVGVASDFLAPVLPADSVRVALALAAAGFTASAAAFSAAARAIART
jgi:predicted MFS family arabinose efflux permease